MSGVCGQILDYSIYKHSTSLNGTQAERMKDAADYFGVTLGNTSRTVNNGKYLLSVTKDKAVITGINRKMLFDFYNNKKSEFEIVTLLAFLAIKSILGKKTFCRITGDFLLCRMAGYGSGSEMSEMEGLPAQLEKYKSRWHLDRLKTELRNQYGLKTYGRYTKGFFVTFDLTEEQLMEEVEKKRKKYIEKTHKEQSNEALKRVFKKLYPELYN